MSLFKSRITRCLKNSGFVTRGASFVRSTGEPVSVLADVQQGFGKQWFVNVGFWLHALGGTSLPDRVEHCHMYYRLERLFPELREMILNAGNPDDPNQHTRIERFESAWESDLNPTLRLLASEEQLRKGLAIGRLEQGLVTAQARQHLIHSAADGGP